MHRIVRAVDLQLDVFLDLVAALHPLDVHIDEEDGDHAHEHHRQPYQHPLGELRSFIMLLFFHYNNNI